MNSPRWDPQLSALALLDAYRSGSNDAVNNILANTDDPDLYIGLVQLSSGLLFSLAHAAGITPTALTDLFRRGMLAGAG